MNICSRMFQGLRHRGIQIFLLLTIYLLLANSLPLSVHQVLYTISIFIKDILIWMLPLTVGFFIAHTIASFQKRAHIFILVLILLEASSNFISVWYGYMSGHIAALYLPAIQLPSDSFEFNALWRFPLIKPDWWSSDKGTILGLIIGFITAFTSQSVLLTMIHRGKEIAEKILTRIFSPLIPVFVLGFVARIYQTHLLQNMFAHYGMLLVWLLIFLIVYLTFLFFIGSGLSRSVIKEINHLLPAGAIAFTSSSSLSTMPWTIEGSAKNLKDPDFAKAVIPATTNIQQVGDCIANAFLCFLIYQHFYGHFPPLIIWLHFSLIFVLARFATAAVLGGAIFIMLPIYESYLSFNAEMIAIILAFNVILDPLITSCNVLGNGALCRIYERIWNYIISFLKPAQKESSK